MKKRSNHKSRDLKLRCKPVFTVISNCGKFLRSGLGDLKSIRICDLEHLEIQALVLQEIDNSACRNSCQENLKTTRQTQHLDIVFACHQMKARAGEVLTDRRTDNQNFGSRLAMLAKSHPLHAQNLDKKHPRFGLATCLPKFSEARSPTLGGNTSRLGR